MHASLRVAGAFVRLVWWYTPVSIALVYAPPRVTVTVAVLTVVALVLWYTRRIDPQSSAQRRATLRLRRIGPAAPWVAGMAIAMPVGLCAVTLLVARMGYGFDKIPDQLGPFLHRPHGWWTVSAMAVLVAPVLEEFGFRGWIQQPLESLVGAPWAIAISAALFALAHEVLLRFPFLFVIGLILGSVVYLTGSIWAGVAMHFGNNAMVMLLGAPPVERMLAHLGQPNAWQLMTCAAASSLLCVWLFRGLLRATRRAGASMADGAPSTRFASGSVPP